MTKINIQHAFNCIKMVTKADKNLITFCIQFDSYKYLTLFFWLINKSSIFQNFINDTVMKYLNDFVMIYFDNILIYSNSIKEHKKHVRKIFQKFRNVDIQIDIDKCEFYTIKIKFLKILIERNKIRINLVKIAAIVAWKISINF